MLKAANGWQGRAVFNTFSFQVDELYIVKVCDLKWLYLYIYNLQHFLIENLYQF